MLKKIFMSLCGFVFCGFIAILTLQVGTALADALPIPTVIQAPTGQALPLILLYGLNVVLSAVRAVLAKIDGVNPGDQIPADKTNLNLINKAAIFLGQIMDLVMMNTQH